MNGWMKEGTVMCPQDQAGMGLDGGAQVISPGGGGGGVCVEVGK